MTAETLSPPTTSAGTLLEPGSPARSALIGFGAAAALLVVTQFVLPGAPGSGRGTPGAILFTGLVSGMITALTAAGLVLIYRTTRIINFAQTAIGAAGAELTFQLVQITEIPFVLALPMGLGLAGLIGLGFDLIFVRRFFHAPRLVLTVLTIAITGLGVAVRTGISNLPFFPEDRSFSEQFGQEEIRDLLPLPGWEFHVGSLPIPFGFIDAFAIEMSVLALAALAAFFRFTRAGVAVRAMAENNERASLLGISVGSLSSLVWVIAGVLGGLSVFLNGAVNVPASAVGFSPGVLLPALAAAVIARFESLPVATAASIAIGVAVSAFSFSFRDDSSATLFIYFLIIAVALLFQHRSGRRGRSEEGAGLTWAAVEEQRPIPIELMNEPLVRRARRVLIVLGLATIALYPYLVSDRAIILGGTVAMGTIVALSIVVLTGWAGQVSLGQFAFAAIGAVVAGALTFTVGVPFWFALPLTAVVTGALAVLLGIPALRIRGLFLAVTTLAFAFALNSVLFNERYFGWLLPDTVERPTLFMLDFADERSMYYLCVAVLVLAIVLVSNLRKSRTGRLLIATRENEPNVQAFGIGLLRAKLTAFAISGALAGAAGGVLAHLHQGLDQQTFAAQNSVDAFLLTVIGGIASVPGALLGSAAWNSMTYFWPSNEIVLFFQPFAAVVVLYALPGGLISIVTRIRDECLKIIAQRRQLVVPSLFADYDPEALERRLIPLGERSEGMGMAAVSDTTRFALASELYEGTGRRIGGLLGSSTIETRRNRDAETIGAAAEAARDVGRLAPEIPDEPPAPGEIEEHEQ